MLHESKKKNDRDGQNVIDMKNAIQDAQTKKIKTLEERIVELENERNKYQISAEENFKRFREQLETNLKNSQSIALRGYNGRIDPM